MNNRVLHKIDQGLMQIKEKALEFQVPGNLSVIDSTRTFDQIKQDDVITLLEDHNIQTPMKRGLLQE